MGKASYCKTLTVCPLNGGVLYGRELSEARQQRPDLLEFRTDILDVSKLGEVLATGIGVLLSFRQAGLVPKTLIEIAREINSVTFDPRIKCIDVELEVMEGLLANTGSPEVSMALGVLKRQHLGGTELILSYHDFALVVQNLEAVFAKCANIESLLGFGVIPKVAVANRDAGAASRFMQNLREISHSRRVICVPMGEEFRNLRLEAALFSYISYAFLIEPNAPGQPRLAELAAFLKVQRKNP